MSALLVALALVAQPSARVAELDRVVAREVSRAKDAVDAQARVVAELQGLIDAWTQARRDPERYGAELAAKYRGAVSLQSPARTLAVFDELRRGQRRLKVFVARPLGLQVTWRDNGAPAEVRARVLAELMRATRDAGITLVEGAPPRPGHWRLELDWLYVAPPGGKSPEGRLEALAVDMRLVDDEGGVRGTPQVSSKPGEPGAAVAGRAGTALAELLLREVAEGRR